MAVDIPNTSQRLLDAAVELLDQRGYHGTGLNEIFALSDTSRGSFYHHFPGGKQDLATAAIHQVGAQLGEVAQILRSAPTPAAALATFAGLLGEQLLTSNFRKGCPIAALAAEATTLPPLVRDAVAGIYAPGPSRSRACSHAKEWTTRASSTSQPHLSPRWKARCCSAAPRLTQAPVIDH